jgi:REP element-mobilizing transposase RayT
MPYDLKIHHRRSIRMPGFDYSQPGSYYVTLVTHNRMCLFGIIQSAKMHLNLVGQCVESYLLSLHTHFPINLDAWIIMPNHVHILMTINQPVSAPQSDILPKSSHAGTLGAIVQNIKSVTTRRVNSLNNLSQIPLWQRNYYEHIIRDQDDFERIREYIQENPSTWQNDELVMQGEL